mmetsp:Transcript_62587/g.93050  ORF Transcript_62587/g.93050 Transcript_62587/m.93050 type:complete len:213 (+) Transcript_62587:356-994(+)
MVDQFLHRNTLRQFLLVTLVVNILLAGVVGQRPGHMIEAKNRRGTPGPRDILRRVHFQTRRAREVDGLRLEGGTLSHICFHGIPNFHHVVFIALMCNNVLFAKGCRHNGEPIVTKLYKSVVIKHRGLVGADKLPKPFGNNLVKKRGAEQVSVPLPHEINHVPAKDGKECIHSGGLTMLAVAMISSPVEVWVAEPPELVHKVRHAHKHVVIKL